MGACVTLILDTGMLTMAFAVGAGDIPSAATDDDDKPHMLRAGSALPASACDRKRSICGFCGHDCLGLGDS
jgi:hypothetical protein